MGFGWWVGWALGGLIAWALGVGGMLGWGRVSGTYVRSYLLTLTDEHCHHQPSLYCNHYIIIASSISQSPHTPCICVSSCIEQLHGCHGVGGPSISYSAQQHCAE